MYKDDITAVQCNAKDVYIVKTFNPQGLKTTLYQCNIMRHCITSWLRDWLLSIGQDANPFFMEIFGVTYLLLCCKRFDPLSNKNPRLQISMLQDNLTMITPQLSNKIHFLDPLNSTVHSNLERFYHHVLRYIQMCRYRHYLNTKFPIQQYLRRCFTVPTKHQ